MHRLRFLILLLIPAFLLSCGDQKKKLEEEIRILREENAYLKAENKTLKKELEEVYRRLEEMKKNGNK